jgi:hypothetical protein
VSAEGVRLTDKGDWWENNVLADPAENRRRIEEAVQSHVRQMPSCSPSAPALL